MNSRQLTVLEHTAGALPPPARGGRSAPERAYALLTSPKLAIALLVGILACCVVGVTVFRGEQAWRLIFSTLWFNALLVLLAVSSAAAFFTRVWRRKLTLVQVGMILFHLSFAALLGGIVYNALFSFHGLLRLTEGEVLPSGALESYDVVQMGRFFDMRRLRGETTLLRMHSKYMVDGQEKRAAYDIEVGEGSTKTAGTIYITRDLRHEGVRYLCAKEGYSVLVMMRDREGREVYGAHVPLQSITQPNGGRFYATGSATEPQTFPFPPEAPRGELLVTFRPSSVKEREGDVGFHLVPRTEDQGNAAGQQQVVGGVRGSTKTRPAAGIPPPESGGEPKERAAQVPVGGPFDAGDFTLTPEEIRYWVGMDVRYDPGLNLILGSLCLGLGGMVLTLIGRIRQGTARRSAA
jgi:hypothetical protein